MKFAHMADVHLGSWSNHPDMKDMPEAAFEKAIKTCISEKVDFIIIAGDLFDTSIPPIESLKTCAGLLKQCVDARISVYVIPGSHDYSPTGKTMLGVLEHAGLLKNVSIIEKEGEKTKLSFVHDKSGAKICGIIGKMGELEKSYYENLDRSIESEPGFKIFVMHSAIEELNNHMGESIQKSMLPKNFDYYANGHVHSNLLEKHEKGYIAFPGPIFPTSFDELENYDSGFYIITNNGALNIERKNIRLFDVKTIRIKNDKSTPKKIQDEIINSLENSEIKDKIVLIKIESVLESGKSSDIDFKKISALAGEKGAIAVKKNTAKLSTKEFSEITANPNMLIDDIENELVKKFCEKNPGKMNDNRIRELMHSLNEERNEGETVAVFENRIKSNAKKLLQVD